VANFERPNYFDKDRNKWQLYEHFYSLFESLKIIFHRIYGRDSGISVAWIMCTKIKKYRGKCHNGFLFGIRKIPWKQVIFFEATGELKKLARALKQSTVIKLKLSKSLIPVLTVVKLWILSETCYSSNSGLLLPPSRQHPLHPRHCVAQGLRPFQGQRKDWSLSHWIQQ